jgi:hypothetical protein
MGSPSQKSDVSGGSPIYQNPDFQALYLMKVVIYIFGNNKRYPIDLLQLLHGSSLHSRHRPKRSN